MQRLVTTYLQMLSPAATGRQRTQNSEQTLEVRELIGAKSAELGAWRFNREMYLKVGERWKWIDKRLWTDAQWQQWASDPNLRTFAGYCGDEAIGYYELHRDAGEVEIAYFGLLPEFIGRGFGSALLARAIETGWAWAPTPVRVWVHTCNRDHPNALANYQARGFEIYKTVTGDA